MRTVNNSQNLTASRMNALQCLREDPTVRHVIYGHRENYCAGLVLYSQPIKLYNDETFYRYCDRSPYSVIYAVHYNEEY